MKWLLPMSMLVALALPADADSPGREALTILKALRTLTTNRTTYAEYLGRVSHAKARIDILLSKENDKALGSVISSSVRLYGLAADIWTEMLQGQGSHVAARERADDVRIVIKKSTDDCPQLNRLQTASEDDVLSGALPAAWSCASDRTNDVERLLGAR